MQDGFHAKQLLPFALHQLCHRDARPPTDDPGDLLLRDLIPQQACILLGVGDLFFLLQLLLQLGQLGVLQFRRLVVIRIPGRLLNLALDGFHLRPQALHLGNGILFVLPLCLHFVEPGTHLRQFLLDLFQVLLGQVIRLLFQSGFLDFVLHDPPGQLVHFRGHGLHLGFDHSACLVHQVNGLIRQEPVGNVPVGQGCRCDQRLILDLDAVEYLVPLLQATENGNGVLYSWLIYHNRLEPTLQSGILLNVLPVFVQGGGTDTVQLAPGKHGL